KLFLSVIALAAISIPAFAQRGPAPVPVRPQQQTFETSKGLVKITPIYHATVLIELPGTQIYIDPAKPAALDELPPAHFVLITDIHPDHMDSDALYTISQAGTRGTRVVAPA